MVFIRYPDYSFSVYSFRKEYTDQNPDAVKAYLRALEGAVERINANPDQYAQVLVDQKLLPQPLVGKFKVPAFVTAGVPSEEQFADALAWARAKGYLENDVAYRDCVNAEFLP